jgi:Domain of unknown function (DUF5615)
VNWTFGLMLDEHMPWAIYYALRQLHPTLPLFHVNDGVAPPNSTPDPIILEWCEDHGCVLVTNNRISMPPHLEDHCRRGRHIEGILTVKVTDFPTRQLIDRLALTAGAALRGEYRDRIVFISRNA